ncbi:MAG TPA: extracellular solute-binding protein [Geminicoccaceae bacterium]|nr:extracellular solute-binding protein [Geminicoccaceae bacterium]
MIAALTIVQGEEGHMRIARRLLGGVVLALLAGTAAAGTYVDRLEDGTILLKLGPGYDNAVIETSVDELGSLIGAGGTPFAGTHVTLLTHDEGIKGPISGPIQALKPVWEELTGGTLEVVLVPIGNLHAEAMLDLERGSGLYDALVVPAFFYGDLIAGGHIAPVEPFMTSGRHPRWSYEVMPPALRTLYGWEGVGYGVLNDADGQILYYRRDVLNDPDERAAFRTALGYDLPVPPRTWQQVLDIARFFDGRNWDHHDEQPDSGMVLHLRAGEQGHYHFQSLSASFAITPGERVDRSHNVYWFDPTTMTPLINRPGHVAALELLLQLAELGPGEQIGWRLPQAWEYFLRGKAVMTFSWGDLGALCQDPVRSQVRGNCAATVLPGSTRHWDLATGAWAETANPEPVGNTTGGSWHGVIAAQSQNQEAAYSFLALMATRPVSLWNVEHGWTGVDPGVRHQFPPPWGDARLADYIKAGWDQADVRDYLGAFAENFTAPTMLNYLRIRGTPDYWAALDRELAAALGHRKSAQQALDDVAAAWEAITDRLGRDEQRRAYQAAIGFADEG